MPIDLRSVSFAAPAYLWLLVLLAGLLVLWAWRLAQRIVELRRLRASRLAPVRSRWSLAGDLTQWLCVLVACAALVLALARPRAVAPGLGRVGLDIGFELSHSALAPQIPLRKQSKQWRGQIVCPLDQQSYADQQQEAAGAQKQTGDT